MSFTDVIVRSCGLMVCAAVNDSVAWAAHHLFSQSATGGRLSCFYFATITNHAAFIIGFVRVLSVPRTRTWSGTAVHGSGFLCSVDAAKERWEGFESLPLPPESPCCSAPSSTSGMTRLLRVCRSKILPLLIIRGFC